VRRSKLAREDRRNLDAHRAVHQQPATRGHGLKESRVRTARANRKKHVTGVAERHRLTGAEIGSEDPERRPHLFEAVGLEDSGEELLHPIAPHESHAADAPARHVSKAH
jgi:hypothetical protein